VIGATHRNLREMIEAGTFREDLYYRLNGLVVRLPALRERRDLDIVAQRILLAECPQNTPMIAPAVAALFGRYAWPGNIRQLANVLRTAFVMAGGEAQITEDHLSDDFLEDTRRLRAPQATSPATPPACASAGPEGAPDALTREAAPASGTPLATAVPPEPASSPAPERAASRTLEEAEIEMIRTAVEAAQGNISVASKRLGISRNTIYRKLRWK
jgi:transcriptional regulator of acetoin/glycerol metabolism